MNNVYKVCAAIITVCVVVATFGWWQYINTPIIEPGGYLANCYEPDSIVVVPIHGDIYWGGDISGGGIVYGYEVAAILDEVEYWGDFAGVIFDIDSPGGLPVASYRTADAINSLTIPTAAVVGDYGMSGGYIIAAATDHIFVNPVSDLGSIGVTASYVSEYDANELSGYYYESFSSAPFKDVGDPARALSDQERAFMQANIQNSHEYFVEYVADNRGLSLLEAARLADGKWYPGDEAITLGLADSIGAIDEAVEHIRSQTRTNNPVCYATLY